MDEFDRAVGRIARRRAIVFFGVRLAISTLLIVAAYRIGFTP